MLRRYSYKHSTCRVLFFRIFELRTGAKSTLLSYLGFIAARRYAGAGTTLWVKKQDIKLQILTDFQTCFYWRTRYKFATNLCSKIYVQKIAILKE